MLEESKRDAYENGNILTYIRIKDQMPGPAHSRNSLCVANKVFLVDKIFRGPDQLGIFRAIQRSILEKCIVGYNCSIFAYGQTGSGKTYTIQGTEGSRGLVSLSLEYLFTIYESIRVSFVEIYNEAMIDLFHPENDVSVREDPSGAVVVDNLAIIKTSSFSESIELYTRGISNRKTAATAMNMSSSRSHSVFTLFLERREHGVLKKSKLCFVDLAGSERGRDIEGDRMKEMCNINKSLLCLGKIVHKLSSEGRGHVSYRDSKLTFLLKDSLGGNSRLAIIGNVSIANVPDTLNTLLFLQRSKRISNTPSINYDIEGASASELVDELRILEEENQSLKDEVHRLKREKSEGIRTSVIFTARRLSKELEEMRGLLGRIKEGLAAHAEGFVERMKQVLLDRKTRWTEHREKQAENIKNIQIGTKHFKKNSD